MRIGFNTVLFGGHPLETALRCASLAGYDGVELSAIKGMSEHVNLEGWREEIPKIKALAAQYHLALLAMEQPSLDLAIMGPALEAAAEAGIPVVNCGPGGKSGDEALFQQRLEALGLAAEKATRLGVKLCVKAHVGAAICNVQTAQRALDAISSPALGFDFDPSHLHRAGEDLDQALQCLFPRLGHVHIRDCRGKPGGPGKPEEQVNGRGDLNLLRFLKTLHQKGYPGPVNLEIIGAKAYPAEHCAVMAAEARGHMQACLQACGAR